MLSNQKAVILIPAYEPNNKLVLLVQELSQTGLPILIVNDGSSIKCDTIFSKIKLFNNTTVLSHAINLGKGQALKTGFNYILTQIDKDIVGVITADADGQHLVKDIINACEKLLAAPATLWLGSRVFKNDVPLRSKFGNIVTRQIFHFLIGKKISDTQTGLRAIPRIFLYKLLQTNSQGYEFELDMLILATTNDTQIQEFNITTVYEDNNSSSHFNPILDSFKIYFVFFRFMFFAIFCGALDFLAFSFMFFISEHILLSETLARIFSGSCNFLLNKQIVFKSNNRLLPEALKYTILVVANLGLSYGLISSLAYLGINVYISKAIALFGLFIANFAIQRLIIFNNFKVKQNFSITN